MFRTWGNLEANYQPTTPPAISWPATCSYSFLIPVLVPHVSARAGVAPPDIFYIFPTPSCGGDPWVKDYVTPLAKPPSRPMQSVNLCIALSLPGNRRARIGFLAHSSSISGGPFILFPSRFILVLSLRPSVLVGSKWAFLHNIALPAARGSVAAAPPVTDIM
jgi:hypothetical protein